MLFAQLLKLHAFVKLVMILYYTGSVMLGLLMMLKTAITVKLCHIK